LIGWDLSRISINRIVIPTGAKAKWRDLRFYRKAGIKRLLEYRLNNIWFLQKKQSVSVAVAGTTSPAEET
jgi:hypothetical protein